MEAKAWKEVVVIPTYEVGAPEKNPMFLEKRVYQGSSGKVYPHPVIENIYDEKRDKKWNAVFLENDYLKIMILPELGGRVQMAYDKIKERHFVYYNRVIKPALVGLTGPWISGGIEFNWPQHHRPSTYEPLESAIEHFEDGSVTVWCNELELMFRTRALTGFKLYPDKAYLEINVKLYNRTSLPQTFLWWANPALHVNDHYQSIFPPDVHAVFDHGKRDVSTFPIATGTYYKVDYSAGVDISRYKNIPVPTSYMAIQSKYDFVGGYEHDSRGGVIHVADHHLSPGKKQWTWGHSDFGQAWDRNLTDNDGPYVELMCGVYTDNQPDFSWLHPNEEKQFKQYFMPYRELGMVKNASKDAMINLEFSGDRAYIMVMATGDFPGCEVKLVHREDVILREITDLSPRIIYQKEISQIPRADYQDFQLTVIDHKGKVLVRYQPEIVESKVLPEPAKAPGLPEDIDHIEQLFLTGLHLEQYRHATYDPRDYYKEALRRDPADVKSNNAMGQWMLRNGQFTQAEGYFRNAVTTLISRNPNPYDGEPYYNLGLSLLYQDKKSEAYAALGKSAWNAVWQDAAWLHMASIDCSRKDWNSALTHVDNSLIRNGHGHKNRHLKAMILRKMGMRKQAEQWNVESLELDGFNAGVFFEQHLITNETVYLDKLRESAGKNIHNYIEYALDYANAGQFKEAEQLLKLGMKFTGSNYPMSWYFLGWFSYNRGNLKHGLVCYRRAETLAPDLCFPHRLEEIIVLEHAIKQIDRAPRALYYLGNLWYDKKNFSAAIECWEASRTHDTKMPTVHRNLALAYYNKLHQPEKAMEAIETAFKLDEGDSRILMELDQLHKRLNYSLVERLNALEKYPAALDARDDLYLERIVLKNMSGDTANALKLLKEHKFHPWEGGEGKVTGQYVFSCVDLAKKALKEKRFDEALRHLIDTEKYPVNLGEGKLYGARENDIYYWKGIAFQGLGEKAQAIANWEKASEGSLDPVPAIYYNDQPPDRAFYQGLAFIKMDDKLSARKIFNKLVNYGQKHRLDKIRIDYFAVSLPDLLIWDDDLDLRNWINCDYLIGLGQLGLGLLEDSEKILLSVLKMDHAHQGAYAALELITDPEYRDILGING